MKKSLAAWFLLFAFPLIQAQAETVAMPTAGPIYSADGKGNNPALAVAAGKILRQLVPPGTYPNIIISSVFRRTIDYPSGSIYSTDVRVSGMLQKCSLQDQDCFDPIDVARECWAHVTVDSWFHPKVFSMTISPELCPALKGLTTDSASLTLQKVSPTQVEYSEVAITAF